MSANKWTPGPWAWRGRPGESSLEGASGKVFDHAAYEGMWLASYNEDTDIANAHLIAAAPRLYAALEALFGDYKQLADSGDAGNWRLEDQDVGKQAMLALATARGERHED